MRQFEPKILFFERSEKIQLYFMPSWKWYVYILELKNGRFYTGLTWNPEVRYAQHLSGLGGKYTARYGVKKLVYLEEHENLEIARMREIQIKDFSQKKKLELINTFTGI